MPATATAASAGADGPRDPVLAATAEAIRRAMAGETDAAPKLQATPTPQPKRERRSPAASATPTATATPAPSAAPQAPAVAGAERDADARAAGSTGDEPLLDYLFGKDGG